MALFERAVLELREAQRLENEDVDTLLHASENGARMKRVRIVVIPALV